MLSDRRLIGIAFASIIPFFNLWALQPALPLLGQEFGATPAQMGMLMTAGTLSVAFTAPFTGALADVVGRKLVIVTAAFLLVVPTVLMAFAPNLGWMLVWRFFQGLMFPPIFAVTVAYIGDEWPPARITRVMSIYITYSVIGGFGGRLVTGLLTDLFDWRSALMLDAVLTAALATAVLVFLPREKKFMRATSFGSSALQMLHHARNLSLLAICVVGFGMMFTLVGTFTYIAFFLAAPPFSLSPSTIGLIYLTHLFGMVALNVTGPGVQQFGRRIFAAAVMGTWIVAMWVTTVPSLIAVMAGLAVASACGMIVQAVTQGFIVSTIPQGKSSAVGLYALIYYIGGSAGGYLPSLAWERGGWTATVAMLTSTLALAGLVIWFRWEKPAPPQTGIP